MRLIDADRLKQHYAWWNNEEQRTFDQIVDAQPTVETAVHGEWKWDNRCGLYTCSQCGALSPRENQDGEYIDCPAYCHECGAKMDGGAQDG